MKNDRRAMAGEFALVFVTPEKVSSPMKRIQLHKYGGKSIHVDLTREYVVALADVDHNMTPSRPLSFFPFEDRRGHARIMMVENQQETQPALAILVDGNLGLPLLIIE